MEGSNATVSLGSKSAEARFQSPVQGKWARLPNWMSKLRVARGHILIHVTLCNRRDLLVNLLCMYNKKCFAVCAGFVRLSVYLCFLSRLFYGSSRLQQK